MRCIKFSYPQWMEIKVKSIYFSVKYQKVYYHELFDLLYYNLELFWGLSNY